ncbi:LytTR family DNA-binding domain-containing protein [Novosphingobium sp. BL-8H]|uniref:LytTR family DNA-binding domain-containing protein n=1 Tax=Novosphingobium sp. BL-8H TaxID=3127640 RepID=UPI003756770D
MTWLRRILIELWAMVVFAAIIGFLGPFGTYFNGDFAARTWRWWMQLMGAYVLVRPSILLWTAIADATSLPRRLMAFWGVLLSSFPLALLWTWSASAYFHSLDGFAGILPFSVLSAIAVLAVTYWAKQADEQLRDALGSSSSSGGVRDADEGTYPAPTQQPETVVSDRSGDAAADDADGPRLLRRLAPGFNAPVIALQSEDHYVRVHGRGGSEMVLIRLRDAVAEMDGMPGEQVHRSWWVARDGIAEVTADGRNRTIRLANGAVAPVARDSVPRLERVGFLPELP